MCAALCCAVRCLYCMLYNMGYCCVLCCMLLAYNMNHVYGFYCTFYKISTISSLVQHCRNGAGDGGGRGRAKMFENGFSAFKISVRAFMSNQK